LSFSFGVQQPSSIGGSVGSGMGKSQFHKISFTKRVDSSSPKLFSACASGETYKEALLTCRRAGGTQADYLIIKLEEAIVSEYEIIGGEDNSVTLPVDKFSLNFSKLQYTYKAQNSDGSQGASTMTGWDLKKNIKI
jgi:type VI secretion system secreted protein Hcp